MYKKKKVLFIVPSFMRGGMENMLVNISNMIVKYADVTIYNLGSHDVSMVDRLEQDINYFSLWNPCKNIKNCSLRDIVNRNFRLLPSNIWYLWHNGKDIHERIVKEEFDIEIAFFVGEPIKIVSGASNAKKIMWIHSDYCKSNGLYNSFINKTIAIKSFASFDRIVCVSQNAERSFRKLTGLSNTKTIYNYLPVKQIRKMAKEKPPLNYKLFTIVAVGRIVEAKGFDRLLNAAILLNKDGFKYQLVIVGDGEKRSQLEQVKRDNRIDNLIFVGNQVNPYPYIGNADLLVCSSRYEGYNLTVAEAIILGVPVLSTNCTGPTEILDNGKYGMVVDNSEAGIYDGLKQLMTDSQLLNQYREAVQKRSDFFSESKICKQILETVLD